MASEERSDEVARVFLSYRREDTGPTAARLAEKLEAELGQGQVFYDRESLRGGEVWPERLEAAVRGSEVVVALIGKGWLKAHDAASGKRRLDDPGDWVRLELETALSVARSRLIVPVLVDGAEMPGERSCLPESIKAIDQLQALPLRSEPNAQWAADVKAILAAIGATGLGRTRDDAHTAAWVAEHLQRLTMRVARRLTASAPVRFGDPAPRHINLSLVERSSEARREASSEPQPQQVYDLEQLASREQVRILVLGEGGAGKTLSLLHVAATAAERARVDPAAPVPVHVDLAQLMRIDDVGDLERLVADATPPANEGASLQRIAARRPCLFLFDAFNEVSEQLHRNCAVALRRFVDTWGDRHRYVVGSRAVAGVELLARPPASFTAYNLLRLSAEQVEEYLTALGLAALHERMPEELRDLARNPFMLVAIARTLVGTAERDLPRNRGKLYQRVLETWMANEAAKRDLRYHYERVKLPVLSHLALRMTAAGQTALSWREVEPEVEQLLVEIHRRIQRRGGMPDGWTVDDFRDEIVADDVLQQTGDRVAFRHQSFQEYFAACWFAAPERADALVELTPKLVWSLVSTTSPMDVSSHRMVPVLTMMVGLVEDGTKLVKALAERNPVTTAAAIASASWVDPAVRATLEQRWSEMLRESELRRRVVASSCLCLVATGPTAVQALVEFALSDLENGFVGADALVRVTAVNELATQLVGVILALDEERYLTAMWVIGIALQSLPIPHFVVVAFERWRGLSGDDARRSRLETVLATIDHAKVIAKLQQFATDTVDAARAADAARALAGVETWDRIDLRSTSMWIHRLTDFHDAKRAAQRDQEAARLKDADIATLEAALSSSDNATRAGAARVIADRRIAIGGAIIDASLREDFDPYSRDLVKAAVDLLGATAATAKLVETSRRDCGLLRHLDLSMFETLPVNEATEGDAAANIPRRVASAVAGAVGRAEQYLDFVVMPSGVDDSAWRVTTRQYFRPQYEVFLSADGLDIYDCSLRVRAIRKLSEIGSEALSALRDAAEHADPGIRSAAIAGLAQLRDPELPDRLLALLARTSDFQVVDAALEALLKLRAPRATALVEDLLRMTMTWSETRSLSDMHPVWGTCQSYAEWSQVLHKIMVAIGADREVAAAIDAALASCDVGRKLAALRELSRWTSDGALEPGRASVWKQASRAEQIVALALKDPDDRVRRDAAYALRYISSAATVESIARALDESDPAVRLAAAIAMREFDAPHLYVRARHVALGIATSPGPQSLRRAAGRVLSELPGGPEPVYQPIEAALERNDPQAALDLIRSAQEILPGDANLLWWRGIAQNQLGLPAEAAVSLQWAFKLQHNSATDIPPVLTQILIDFGDFVGAAQIARHGVELSKYSADAHALLAWSCYRANTIAEAVAAARMACDLDPVHPRAIWILVLALLRTPVPGEARAAADHALRVRELLSPGLDTSFLATFTAELDALAASDEASAQLIAELRPRLAAPVQSSL